MGSSLQPGLLLVHPRLRSPDVANASTFHRWTKLHFRDLLNMPANASSGAKVNACIRATAPDPAKDYSHEETPGTRPAYVYSCFVSDIGVLKSQPYYSVSRKLNLEHTRALAPGEQPVDYHDGDKEAMVFHLVDAKFAVYEELDCGARSPSLAAKLQTSEGNLPGAPAASLVRVNFRVPPGGEPTTLATRLHASLRECLKNVVPQYTVASSVYRWAGREAQPDEHPFIDVEGGAEWMILVYFEDLNRMEDRRQLQAIAEDTVGMWAQGAARDILKEGPGRVAQLGEMLDYGAWEAEVFV